MKFPLFGKQNNKESLGVGANGLKTPASAEEVERARDIITNLTDGLLVFDNQNRLSLINPMAEKFFDIKAELIIGQFVLDLIKFLNLEPLVRLLGEEIGQVSKKELLIGEKLVLEASTAPVMRGSRKTGTVVVLHDVTREKTMEKLKTEFVSLAAHQLRTPLAAIKWALKMLLNGDLGEVPAEQREVIRRAYESNEIMIDLINSLLNVAKIEEGKYIYRPTPVRLEDIVQSVIDSLNGMVRERKILMEFKKPERKLPTVSIDIEKMKVAIQNLIHNALRYTVSGGKIIASLKLIGKEVEFSVKDTGVGIPKSQQARVFTKFFRGDNAVRMEAEGSGLGLYLAKNIVEAHGGRIWFESEEGKGSTFYLTLPTP